MLPEPYYQDESITLYCGDCREILPLLPRHDLLLTDPPYGIGRANGMGGKGYDGFGNNNVRVPRSYTGNWDDEKPSFELLMLCVESASNAVIWGGNYFARELSESTKWLIWDKQQTMPSFSDAELAWTNFTGTSTKMFRFNGSGLMAVEKHRVHPTQKPVALMRWCLSFAPDATTILDPFAGSGTTGVAAKLEGRKATLIELSEEYCEKAVKRFRQKVLFGPELVEA